VIKGYSREFDKISDGISLEGSNLELLSKRVREILRDSWLGEFLFGITGRMSLGIVVEDG